MATPESIVKKEIKAYLDSIGAYYFMPVQMGLGAATVDMLCCVRGRFVGVEVKAGDNQPTKRQLQTLGKISNAGGVGIIAWRREHVETELRVHKVI